MSHSLLKLSIIIFEKISFIRLHILRLCWFKVIFGLQVWPELLVSAPERLNSTGHISINAMYMCEGQWYNSAELLHPRETGGLE